MRTLTISDPTMLGQMSGPPIEGGSVTEIPGWIVHTFTSSGTLTVNRAVSVEYLVIAGGGGGGGSGASWAGAGGWGGAGGLLAGAVSLSPGLLPVAVGAGGVAGIAGGAGGAGGNSAWNGLTAVGGGGGGGGGTSPAGGSGGSGGGGGTFGAAGGSGTVGQGNKGGNANTGPGGGGGAGGAGGNGNPNWSGGSYGPGVTSAITGVSVEYARGGGGFRTFPPYSPGDGGEIGGWTGGVSRNGLAGSAGIVVVRYATLAEPVEMPLAWWKLDEASGPTFYDSSGNGRNLTVAGSWSFLPASPAANGSASIGDGVWQQDPFRLEIECTMTLPTDRYIISKDSGGGQRQWILYSPFPAAMSWYVSGVDVTIPSASLPSTIERIECGWDGSTIWLSVNGSAPITKPKSSMYDTASPIILGSNVRSAAPAQYHQIRYWKA